MLSGSLPFAFQQVLRCPSLIQRKEIAMKDKNQTQTTKTSNKPSHSVYVVKDNNGKSRWVRVGAAWEHADHEGMTQIISMLDMDITLTIRKNKEIAE